MQCVHIYSSPDVRHSFLLPATTKFFPPKRTADFIILHPSSPTDHHPIITRRTPTTIIYHHPSPGIATSIIMGVTKVCVYTFIVREIVRERWWFAWEWRCLGGDGDWRRCMYLSQALSHLHGHWAILWNIINLVLIVVSFIYLFLSFSINLLPGINLARRWYKFPPTGW